MRSSWKGLLPPNEGVLPLWGARPLWADQVGRGVLHRGGRGWVVQGVRPYYLVGNLGFFTPTGPAGRPNRDKWARKGKRRK